MPIITTNSEKVELEWRFIQENTTYQVIKNLVNNFAKASPVTKKKAKTIGIDSYPYYTLEKYYQLIENFIDKQHPSQDIFKNIIAELYTSRPSCSRSNSLNQTVTDLSTQERLLDFIIEKHCNLSQAKLKEFFTESRSNGEIKGWLKNHYEKIKGSCLDYTLMPEHRFTKHMMCIAEKIADLFPSTHALEIMMPGLNIIGIDNNPYKISNLIAIDRSKNTIKDFLSTFIALPSKPGNYVERSKDSIDTLTHSITRSIAEYCPLSIGTIDTNNSSMLSLFEPGYLKALLKNNKIKFIEVVIHDNNDGSCFLLTAPLEAIDVFLSSADNFLRYLLNNFQAIEFFNFDVRMLVLKYIHKVMTSAQQFKHIAISLDEPSREYFLESCKEKLLTLINSANDFVSLESDNFFANEVAKINKYKERIEKNKNSDGSINFRKGIWFECFFAGSANRKRSYVLVSKILTIIDLLKVYPNLTSLNFIKEVIQQELNNGRLYSAEVNSIIADILVRDKNYVPAPPKALMFKNPTR